MNQETASIGQFHKLVSCLLNKYPEMEKSLEKDPIQVLIKDEERLVNEFILFINNSGMPNNSHVIDCGADPFLFHKEDNYYIKKFIKYDKFVWNPDLIKLIPIGELLDKFSDSSGKIDGWKMFEYFNDAFNPCNGNFVDYLIKFSYLIPEYWKEKPLLFLNTVYGKKYEGKKNHDAYVRFLGCDYSGCWTWGMNYFRVMHSSNTVRFFNRKCEIKDAVIPCFF